MAGRRLSPEVEAGIQRAAQRTGIDPTMLRAFVMIESSGNPNLVNKYGYSGLLQLQPSEYRQLGGQGSVLDIDGNLTTGAAKLRNEAAGFKARYGRDPTGSELYLMHQQGVGGSANHWANPDRPAWQNMAATGEGRQKGEGWAKRAIWDNLPDSEKRRFGSVDNVTSRDFVKVWDGKYASFSGTGGTGTPLPTNDPFAGPATIATDGSITQPSAADASAPMAAFARPEQPGSNAPAYVASATPSGGSGGFGGGSKNPDNDLSFAASWFTQNAADEQKSEAERKAAVAKAESARNLGMNLPDAPAPRAPQLPRVNLNSLLAVLKERGVDPLGGGALGSGGNSLGTRRA